MKNHKLRIGGEWVGAVSGKTFPIINRFARRFVEESQQGRPVPRIETFRGPQDDRQGY